jgi:MscS family membrane protein
MGEGKVMMDTEWQTWMARILTNSSVLSVLLAKLLLIAIVLVVVQVIKKPLFAIAADRAAQWTCQTESTVDDQFVEIIKPPLGWLIFLAGVWIAGLILAPELGEPLRQGLNQILNGIAVSIVAYLIYCLSPLVGQVLGEMTTKTETELDDLLVSFLPKLFQAAAIVVFILKASELFLGASASAIVGLLGGAGVAFGLLIKDVIYDWFCTVLIFTDQIYRPGDRLTVAGIDGFVTVLEIGLRSTKLRVIKWDAIQKIPNSKMIGGVVENWTQSPTEQSSYGINLTLKIDNLSATKAERVYRALQEIPKSLEMVSDQSLVRLEGVEGNARVFRLRAFVQDWEQYYEAEAAVNLAILQMLEQEAIAQLQIILTAEAEPRSQR